MKALGRTDEALGWRSIEVVEGAGGGLSVGSPARRPRWPPTGASPT